MVLMSSDLTQDAAHPLDGSFLCPALFTDTTLSNIAAVQTVAAGACRTNYTVSSKEEAAL